MLNYYVGSKFRDKIESSTHHNITKLKYSLLNFCCLFITKPDNLVDYRLIYYIIYCRNKLTARYTLYAKNRYIIVIVTPCRGGANNDISLTLGAVHNNSDTSSVRFCNNYCFNVYVTKPIRINYISDFYWSTRCVLRRSLTYNLTYTYIMCCDK